MDSTGSDFIEKKAYWSLIEGIGNLYPEFVKNLELQDNEQRNSGRAAVLEFHNGKKAHITNFGESGEALDKYLKDFASGLSSSPGDQSTQRRRLFLLEDLGRDKVQTLGARLRIPPDFFAAHWLDPIASSIAVDHDFLPHKRTKYFRCIVPQLHSLVREGQGEYRLGLYESLGINIQRYLQLLDRNRLFESSLHQVSFWSTSTGNGSWTCVLLVDPVITEAYLTKLYANNDVHVILLDHPESGYNRIPVPSVISMDPLPSDSSHWGSVPRTTCNMSIYDNIISMYTKLNNGVADDPKTCVAACRQITLTMWKAFLGFREIEYIRFSDNLNFGKPLDNLHGWFHTWDTRWRVEAFHNLLYQQLTASSIVSNVRHAMRVFAVEATDTAVDEREREEWQALLLAVASLKEQIANLISGYSQEASIQESKTSNYQARSVGRLTSLATILVPFSVTAALFSMGGDFQAGQSLFWVFWVIATPIAAILYLGISFYERKTFNRDRGDTRVADNTQGIV